SGFRLQFDNQEELALVRESVEILLDFANVTGQTTYDASIRQQGYLWVATEHQTAGLQRELVAMQHGWGQDDIELLPGDEVRYRFPYIAERGIQPRSRQGDGFCNPKQLARGLAAGPGAAVLGDGGASG